ncbi:SpoIIE family protein phosphatase, partial [Streptomyces lavendulae]
LQEVPLPPGTLLALYTDGLIEARDRDLDEGMERLARALRGAAQPLEALCEGILAGLLPAAPQDDVAVLLARPRPL